MIEKLVSVIIPAYNSEKTVQTSVDSVLNQTYANYEILIIDDASSDNTLDTIRKNYGNHEKIKIFGNTKNLGAGETRNSGILKAKGEFIAFLDSDDEWYPEKLEKQINVFENYDVALVCSGFDISDEKNKSYRKKQPHKFITYRQLLKTNHIGCLTAIYSAKKIGKQYMLSLRKRQDYALWLSITKLHGPAICCQEILAKYKITENSISSNKLSMIKWNYVMFRNVTDYSKLKCMLLVLQNSLIKILNG